ncbi:MAG: Nucleoside triphosphate pyrophosphohydrolase [Firmicutes bacterium]|nr:Nucleoside triphosphate pyrophosphohydrolase [Bacillota bacterium]
MINVVGLGPGDPGLIGRGAWELLTNPNVTVVLRTGRHPAVAALREAGVNFSTFDDLYATESEFSAVYQRIADAVLALPGEVVYAVPGSPFVAEATVPLLRRGAKKRGRAIRILPAVSSLEAVCGELELDPTHGMVVQDALVESLPVNPQWGLLLTQVSNRLTASDLKLKLLLVYPPEHAVSIVRAAGQAGASRREVSLAELDHREFTHEDTIYIPPCKKAHHLGTAMEAFLSLMDVLQGEHGCPWDREQTHLSLRPFLIEETYEVLEAIESNDSDALAEELGDLLLQVVFHAHLASREHRFDLVDCIESISRKLIRRHPHVFGDVQISGADEVLSNWHRIKQGEKAASTREGLLDGIPNGLPALAQAYKLQHKAKQVGFDWPTVEGAWGKLCEELRELEAAVARKEQEEVASEMGDALFSLVNVSRFLKVEPETALRDASLRFRHRFDEVLRLAQVKGLDPRACGLEELDKLWEAAKRKGF